MLMFFAGLFSGALAALGIVTIVAISHWAPGLFESYLPRWLRNKLKGKH